MITAEELFDMLNADMVSENPFETEELANLASTFRNKHVKPFIKDNDKYDEAFSDLATLLECEEKNAFIAGFNTAISLILGRK